MRPASRLACAILAALMGAGGGELPALDGLLFHTRDREPAPVVSHLEPAGGCHSDQCAIRSVAQQSRFAAVAAGHSLAGADPGAGTDVLPEEALHSASTASQPFSRAPPSPPA